MSKAIELIKQVKDFCMISDTTYDTTILQKLNLVQWQLYNSHFHWRDLETYSTVATVDGQAYSTVPTDMGVLYDLRQGDTAPYVKLEYVAPQKFHALIPQPTLFSEEKPRYYTWWGGRLYFYPIPDAAYNLTAFYYKKPTGMKLYSVATAAVSTTALTGTSTYWKDNANTAVGMYFAFQADLLSDGTFPWALIKTLTDNTNIVLDAAYTGAGTTGTYYINSLSTYTDFFDLALIYGATIMMGSLFREIRESSPWFQEQYKEQLSGLAEAQVSLPDYRGIVEDFTPVGPQVNLAGQEYKYPFIQRSA